ncbi:LOW QUALITY PROTEIN: uncharacterized protein [Argopecten irradians]|uniref:LOW QUALITY PROTEIN: uncharacterized protein n=1 Tax=Argopecten irradians TaxID=31199 RepID=UPI00371FAB17
MASTYPSQTETTNFARLSRLVLDVCSDVLRDVLDTHIPPPGLHAILKSQKHHLRQKLISRQLSILYPPGNVFLGTLKDFDFSLLYSLVRNIQGINISPHTKGWGKKPDATDRSLAANIDRLRVQRNEAYGHLPKASLSDTDFHRIWGIIRQCVSEIDQGTLTGDTYVREVDNLLTLTMDPDTEKELIERLKKQRDEFEAVVEGLTAEQKSMSARQDTMETEQKSMSARQDTMETEQKSMSARQDTMETEQKSMSARQDTMEIEQKSMTARLDTVENQQKTMTANQESKTKEIHPDLKPMIETTINRIRMEKEKKFLETKAFHDAQDKLRMNRVLVIKGNTGDGKTSTAFQLLNWLLEEEQCRKPLQLHEIKDLKLLAPNSNLVCIIDDIFGQKDISKSDEGEWNKRLKDVETLFVDKQNQTNILLITIRNEIFNALTEQSLETVFTEENIVDLSSDKYQIKEEKQQQLLAIYTPKIFSWDEKEITKILGCKLHIGFPQCCHLFCKSVELQKRRTDFFENPIKFFIDALSKLPECSAILFLFLNNGEIKVNDLDPNGDKVNKTLLEQAFRIKLVQCQDRTKREYVEKVDFVRESLDKLLGFLVRKVKYWSGEEVYRFDHDSIFVTVALLYGKKTPVGYIKHCPRKALSYLTTVKTSTDMVVISPGHYNDLCERLLPEFESVKDYDVKLWYDMEWYDTVIGSLDVWKDPVFVEIFDKYLNEKKVNKVNILNKACLSGSVQLALYLLKNGVKPDEDTDWWRLITRGRVFGEGDLDILKEIVVYLNDEMKQKLLNEACESGSSECVMYLLSVGVKPDKDTDWWRLITRGRGFGEGDLDILKEIVVYLNDEMKQKLLNKACEYGSSECGMYLLSVGVKPDKDTDWWRLMLHVVRRGSMDLYNTVRQYGVTPTWRDGYGRNVLHVACLLQRESIVADLCKDYPDLVHGTDEWGQTPLHMAAGTGNCSVFQTVEKTVLKCLCRHQCLRVDGSLVHIDCECSQYMCKLVNRDGETVLHVSCMWGQKDLCLYICRSYPAMTACRDRDGRHCLHYIAGCTTDVDWFIECERHVRKHTETLKQNYDIKTILNGEGKSVLDLAKERTERLRLGGRNPLYDHLLGVFSK